MKIKKYLLIVFAGTTLISGLSSCDNDFLAEDSFTFNDQTFYSSETELELALNPCYGMIQALMMGQTHGHHSYMIRGVGLDTFAQTSGNGEFANWNNLTSDSGLARHWYDNLYVLINRANTVINAIDERPDIKYKSEAKKNELRAAAVFFRGWAYRALAGMYGAAPILEKASTEIFTSYTPSSRQEVWEFCKKDFTFAAQNLPLKGDKPGKLVRAAADHYLAEVNLALGDFQGAVDAATRVIDGTDGDFQLMTSRFGSRAAEKTDRYGNSLEAPAGAYWDLFREGGNQNSPANKEALWVCQYNYDTYSTGGGGNQWWRLRCNTYEANWLSPAVLGLQTTSTLADGKLVYKWGANVACLPEGAVDASGKPVQGTISNRYGAEGRVIANMQRDSLGGNVPYMGNNIIPVYYVRDGIWNYSKNQKGEITDFRGSDVMIQRNWYTPGGTRWLDEKAAAYARAKAAVGTPDEQALCILASDTVQIFPRFWKFSDDKHPKGDNKAYDCDLYMIRIAETYLVRAEAYLALNKKAEAAADINELHARANAPYCTANDINIDYILDERTRELLGEEDRWITLNRLSVNPNCTYVTDKYPVQDETTSNTMYERVRKYGFGYENLSGANQPREWNEAEHRYIPNIKPYNYQLPIPTAVIDSNSGAEFPQNTGYGK